MHHWLIALIGAVVGVGLFLWWYGQRPYRYKNIQRNKLARFLETLLHRGYQGGLLILETKRSGPERKFLQFSKYIGQDGRAGLEFGFPLAVWSRPYYDVLRKELEAEGIRFQLHDTGRQDTLQFLVVDIGPDVALAQRVADLAVHTVFGSTHSSFQAFYQNVSPRAERIGR